MKRIIYLRSNDANPDPRLTKEVNAALRNGFSASILAWDRYGTCQAVEKVTAPEGEYCVKRFKLESKFGSGIRNILKLMAFQCFLVKSLFLNRKNIDIIHAADFDTVIPAVLMKIFYGKSVVYDIYDFYVDAFPVPSFLKKIIRIIDIKIISFVDAVILPVEYRLEQISGSNPRKVIYVHNTPERMESTEKLLNKNDKLIFSYVGILQDHRFLKQIINFAKKNNGIELNIAGFGLYEDYVADCSEKFENIKYYGKVPYRVGLNISAKADILFAIYDPSIKNHKYSAPNKFYEALMLERPILVSNETGVDELVRKNKVGWCIDYNESAFSDFLKSITKNEINEVSKNMRKVYDEQYSWEVMEKRLIDLYNSF